ncbi:MAG: DsbA family protein [Thermoplasmata archaeon]|nr:DsbA family protein [Thermoplasmata archaeon]
MAEELPDVSLPVEERDHILGPLSAPHQLLEYGDFESPHCRHVAATVHELLRELGDGLCFAFRNYPQPKLHPRSRAAAEAAEAAGLQGKFWLMHDRLFQHQGELGDAELREIARSLPVDMVHFERDLKAGDAARRVDDDIELAEEDAVGDTPTFFVNGRLHTGLYEFVPLLKALQASTVK